MTDSQSLIAQIISKGNDIIKLSNDVIIFRASVAYSAQQIRLFLLQIKPKATSYHEDPEIQAIKQIYECLDHYASFLLLLTGEKWIQPALNWPCNYIHNYIDKFRVTLSNALPTIGIDSQDLKYDDQQDQVNKEADYQDLKISLKNLMANVSLTDAVGVQQQIETKLHELRKYLPRQSKRHQNRRPSGDSVPMIQVQHRVEELLSRFKNINIDNEDLNLNEQIGAGGFGTVVKATRLSTGEVVAVKELRSDKLTMSSWTSLYAEIENMAAVRHPFLLELVGAHITEPYRIITRFCPGKSLFDRLHRDNLNLPRLSPTRLTRIAYQVACGMEHLHSMSIVHRDLKTLNILLDEHEDGCVADFGLSGMMKDNQELAGGVGTPHYTAPEVLSHAHYGPRVDNFSYGVVLWEMLTQKVPYIDLSQAQIYEHVVTRGWRLPIPADTPEGLKKLITRLWSKNPNDRPAFSEIVQQFENGTLYFPGSETINFAKIKTTRHCPLLDINYVLDVLSDVNSKAFSSICYFLSSHADEEVIEKLQQHEIIDCICKKLKISENEKVNKKQSKKGKSESSSSSGQNSSPPEQANDEMHNLDAILLLAATSLRPTKEAYESFLAHGGLQLFQQCVRSDRGQQLSAALRFGLKVPGTLLGTLQKYLPDIFAFVKGNIGSIASHVLQFITRFDQTELLPYKELIAATLMAIVGDVDDQPTFDAIVTLLPLCRDSFDQEQMRTFYRLLESNFIVPAQFVESLVTNDISAELLFAILKASARSDLSKVFLDYLKECATTKPEVFEQLWAIPTFTDALHELLRLKLSIPSLFITFSIAKIPKAQGALATLPLLGPLVSTDAFQPQRLQIFTVLCLNEDFCIKTKYMDGIIHLLVSSLSNKDLVFTAAKLIGALSSHQYGCSVLSDNGVLELFTQLFLSSSSGDTTTSHEILKNFSKHGGEIPQGSLIVSCLMQDMNYDPNRRESILDTIVALVETMPGSVQEHDLERIILQQINPEFPLLSLLAIKLLCVCDIATLRNIYTQVLASIYRILSSDVLYPELLETSLMLIQRMNGQFDIRDFIQKTELRAYLENVLKIIPKENEHYERIAELANVLN